MASTGKSAEDEFEERWKTFGKRAAVWRLVDASDLYGLNKKTIVNVPESPADYIVAFDGEMFLAEVKATSDEKKFAFKMLRKSQKAAALKARAAGARYDIFVFSTRQSRWFRIPSGVVSAASAEGKASIPWAELTPYEWNLY